MLKSSTLELRKDSLQPSTKSLFCPIIIVNSFPIDKKKNTVGEVCSNSLIQILVKLQFLDMSALADRCYLQLIAVCQA